MPPFQITDVVLDALERLAGPEHWQRFEHFVRLLIRHRWPTMTIHRHAGGTGGGGPDFTIEDPKKKKLVAAVECKVREVRSIRVDDLLRQFDVIGRSELEECVLAVATRLPQTLRKDLDAAHITIWGPDEIASQIEGSRHLSSMLDLGLRRDLMSELNLEFMEVGDRRYGGVFIATLLAEVRERAAEDDEALLGHAQNVVHLFGNPYVGKSCLAIKLAARWMISAPKRTAYIVNCAHQDPSIIAALPQLESSIVIVDDVHYLDAPGKRRLDEVIGGLVVAPATAARSEARFIIISREPTDLGPMTRASMVLQPLAATRIPRLVMSRLRQRRLPLWQCVAAVMSGTLEPTMVERFRPTSETTKFSLERLRSLRKDVTSLAENQARELLVERNRELGDKGYELYLFLLPFTAMNFAVPDSFIRDVGFHQLETVQRLVKCGLARRSFDGELSLRLTEHPAQCLRLLSELDAMPERAMARRWASDAGHDAGRIESTAITRYLRWTYPNIGFESTFESLRRSAEWTGSGITLAYALKQLRSEHWLEFGHRRQLELGYLKFGRQSVGLDPVAFAESLHLGLEYWRSALDEPSRFGLRRDQVLYELGYLRYLEADYEGASEYFDEATRAAVDLIARASSTPISAPNFDALRDSAATCVSRFWVSSYLANTARHRAALRKDLASGARGKGSMADAHYKVTRSFNALRNLNQELKSSNESTRRSDRRIASALRRTLIAVDPTARRINEIGLVHVAQNIQSEAAHEWLGRHEINGWVHSIQTALWPQLFLRVSSGRPVPKRLRDYQPTFAPWPAEVGSAWFDYQARIWLDLLAGVAVVGEGERRRRLQQETLFEKIIENVSIARAGGVFEYLGDMLVGAVNCAPDLEAREAVCAMILDEVYLPRIGMNDLAKDYVRRRAGHQRRR